MSENPAGDQYTPTNQQVTPPEDTGGAIPFTGLETGVLVVVALGVLVLGGLMRKLAR